MVAEFERLGAITGTLDRSVFKLLEVRTQPAVRLIENTSIPLEPGDESGYLTFGRQLTLLRRQYALSRGMKKLPQRQLAFKAGIDHGTLSRLENGKIQDPSISVVTSLVGALALEPDSPQILDLIASLAKERDKAYINGLLGLSGNSDVWRPYVLNTGISKAVNPVDKIKDYKKRRNERSIKGIAKIGGINYSFLSRFLSGKIKDISGSSFIAIVRGLDLTTKEQVLDLFYSFGVQRNGSAVTEAVEQKAS